VAESRQRATRLAAAVIPPVEHAVLPFFLVAARARGEDAARAPERRTRSPAPRHGSGHSGVRDRDRGRSLGRSMDLFQMVFLLTASMPVR